jgi:excisionase family DNA binding protein
MAHSPPQEGMSTLLRPEEVARALAVSRTTVLRLARSGELASLRTRGQVRFRPEAVEEYLARAETGPQPQAPPTPAAAPSPRRGWPRKQWVPSYGVGPPASSGAPGAPGGLLTGPAGTTPLGSASRARVLHSVERRL